MSGACAPLPEPTEARATASAAPALEAGASARKPIAAPRTVDVEITEKAITVRGRHVLAIPEDAAEKGLPAASKRKGPNDLYLLPVADAWKAVPVQERARPLVRITREVPFRVLSEVLYTLGQNESQGFDIEDPAEPGRVPLAVRLARLARLVEEGEKRLDPVVFVTDAGLVVKVRAGNVAPGCDALGAGVTVPRSGAVAQDVGGLTRCLQKIKASDPDFADEETVVLSGNRDVRFKDLAETAAAVRGTFPVVELRVPR